LKDKKRKKKILVEKTLVEFELEKLKKKEKLLKEKNEEVRVVQMTHRERVSYDYSDYDSHFTMNNLFF
jgi:hypothetical protein